MTFLFTDIEDSTRLWKEVPTDMADGLRAHDTIVRGTIERHGGYVFGTGGDGFCAAFSTTRSITPGSRKVRGALPRWCPASTTCA